MMYEDLVKQLRELHPEEFGDKWDFAFACQQAMHEAADAIEELSRLHEAQRQNLITLMNEDQEMEWISVTDEEHIPNTDHGVVGYFGGGAFNQLRWYDFVTTLSDGTLVGENTERDVMNEHCIAVFKLPEPPKEMEP